jgi:hypothetical protein
MSSATFSSADSAPSFEPLGRQETSKQSRTPHGVKRNIRIVQRNNFYQKKATEMAAAPDSGIYLSR